MSIIKNNMNWNTRYKRNCFVYLIIYGLIGAVVGITNNTFISYLDIVTPSIVRGLNIFTAIGYIIMAIILIYVHKIGYKKVLIIVPIITIFSMILVLLTDNFYVVAIVYPLITAGVSIYGYMYPLMYTVYVPYQIRITMMSLILIVNISLRSLTIFLGGRIVVRFFSYLMHISYFKASIMSSHPKQMNLLTLDKYINSYKIVICLAIVFILLAFLGSLFLKEKKSDYVDTSIKTSSKSNKINFKIFLQKDIVLFLIFLFLLQIGSFLVIPYIPIYLNIFLHIPRDTVSTIITLQTLFVLVGYFLAPWLEKKMGSIVSISLTMIICTPLMLLLADGRQFKSNILLISIIMMLRSGLANASMPIQQSLRMLIVPKDLRPAFSSLMTIISAIVGLIVGTFTSVYLLKKPQGYAIAYFISAIFYFIACLFLLILKKKYNRIVESSKK